MRTVFLITLLLFSLGKMLAQSNCKVKLEALNKVYEGECKKGYAQGYGEAQGEEDTYKGAFKKGLPHGQGTYVWSNGNTYQGSFVKGKMHGKGILIIKDAEGKESLKKGYFEKDEYIGEYKNPYAISSKREVKNVYVQEDPNQINGEQYQITIKVKNNGVYVIPQSLVIIDENATNTIDNVLANVKFPCKKIDISFRYADFSSRVVLDIYKKGNWIIEITI